MSSVVRAFFVASILTLLVSPAELRLRVGDPLYISSWGSVAPVQVTFQTSHNLQPNDLISCHGVQGQQNINSNVVPGQWQLRRVKTVVSATSVTLADEAGNDIQPIPGATQYDLLNRQPGNQLGFCGKVQAFQTAPFPRGIIPQSGDARARIVNNQTANMTIWNSLKARFVDSFSSPTCDGVSPTLCAVEESQVAAVTTTYANPGLGQGDNILTLALGWLKTGNAQYLNSARYYLNNAHRILHIATFAACYSGLQFCGNGQTNDWSNLALRRYADAYAIVRDQMTASERSAFANKILNNFADGCTNQMTGKLGELNQMASGVTTLAGTGLSQYQVGDYIVIAYDLATLRGSRGDIAGVSASGGVVTVTVSTTGHTIKLSRFLRISGSGTALDSPTPYIVTGVSGTQFTFAAAVPDGTYAHSSMVIEQSVYNGAEVLGRHRVVQSGTSIQVTPALSTAQVGAEHRRVPRWAAGNCGILWYAQGHGYYPAFVDNVWSFIKNQNALAVTDTSIVVTADTWANIPAGTGWWITTMHSNGVTMEIMQVTGRNDATRTLTVTRGMFATPPLSKSANTVLNVRVSQPRGNVNAAPAYIGEFTSNHTPTRLAPAFALGLALADDDPRARALAEASWAYWRDLTLPYLERHWTGVSPSGGNEGYAFGRWVEMMARMELNLRNSLTTQPYNMMPMLSMVPSQVLHWSMSGIFQFMHFFSDAGSDSSLGANLWSWLPVTHYYAPSTLTSNVIFYWRNFLAQGAAWSTNYDAATTWMIYADENDQGTDFRSTRPPWFHARSVVATQNQKPYAYMDSRTDWSENAAQIISLYPHNPTDHLGAYQSFAQYRLHKKVLLMGPLSDLAGGSANSKQPGILVITPFRSGNNQEDGIKPVDDMRYGSQTARFVRVNCLDCYPKPGDYFYTSTVPVTRHLRYLIHFPAGGNDYVVAYDDWAASSSIASYLSLPYWTRKSQYNTYLQSPYVSFSRTSGSIQFRSNQYSASLLTQVVLPDPSYTTDNWATVSANPGGYYAVDVRVTPPNSTGGQYLVVHRMADGVTATMPTVTLLSSGGSYRAVQVADSQEPKVAVFPIGGTLSNPTWTSTHSGTGRYLVTGLQSGTYRVKRNSSDYLTGISVGSEVGALEFTGSSGAYEVIRDGDPPAVTVTTSSLPDGVVGQVYSQSLSAAGGTPPYSWTVVNGALCDGLQLSSGGSITGTPTQAQTCSFTVQAADSDSPPVTGTRTLGITIQPGAAQLTITTSSPLPGATVGVYYSTSLAASGGTAPYSWTLQSGSLPNGLQLSSGGAITGTPTTQGTYTFTVRVTDSVSATADKSFSLTVSSAPQPLTITTTSPLPDATVGQAYSQSLSASGGTPPYSWSQVSGFPSWLTLGANGVLSGTPQEAASYVLRVRVTDAVSTQVEKDLSLTSSQPPPNPLEISTGSPLPGATQGTQYSLTFVATGGVPPYSWQQTSGTIPPGLYLSASGVLSGAPTATGNYTFTVQVTDSQAPQESEEKQFSLFVSASPLSVEVYPVGTAAVVRYGYTGLPQDTACTVSVVVSGTEYHNASDGGGAGRRFARVLGLPESSSGTATVTCGATQASAGFVTGQAFGGTVSFPIRLSPIAGAAQVTVEWGQTGLDYSTTAPCSSGCIVTLPSLTRDALYRIRWTWKDAGGTAVGQALETLVVAK